MKNRSKQKRNKKQKSGKQKKVRKQTASNKNIANEEIDDWNLDKNAEIGWNKNLISQLEKFEKEMKIKLKQQASSTVNEDGVQTVPEKNTTTKQIILNENNNGTPKYVRSAVLNSTFKREIMKNHASRDTDDDDWNVVENGKIGWNKKLRPHPQLYHNETSNWLNGKGHRSIPLRQFPAPTPDEDVRLDGRRVYVLNIPYIVDWRKLRTHMSHAGTVTFVVLNKTSTGRSKGTAVVTYLSEYSAQYAIENLHNSTLEGRQIKVYAFRREADRTADNAASNISIGDVSL